MDNFTGFEVFCTKNGIIGEVVHQDAETITIQAGEVQQSFTHRQFNNLWVVVPQEKSDEVVLPDQEPKQITTFDNWGLPQGIPGIGLKLRDQFIRLINKLDIDEVVIKHQAIDKRDVVKYNGFNVFETEYASRRFTVLANPKSLTPMNRKHVIVTHPNGWNWTLKARFIFTRTDQWPLMKSIINDGLFYRSGHETYK